ncbi:MAG: hypothetical protein KGZ97_00280 [Bacteroidetes bacterium]|nr:hypothetical protein [Bacteroidota bacterium]
MKKVTILLFIVTMINATSCITIKRASTFSKCEFRVNKVDKITLNGIDVMDKSKISDFSRLDVTSLLTSIATGPLLMDMTLFVDIKNPNKSTAAMNRIDWIMLIDDFEIMTGSTIKKVVLPPNDAIVTVPIEIKSDLKEVISSGGGSALLGLALNLSGISTNVNRVTFKAKPYIKIGSKDIAYPGYINIRTDFTAE